MTAPQTVINSYCERYPQTRRAVGQARRMVVAFARTCGFVGQSLGDIEIAVGEALANAFEHGNGDSGGTFEVAVSRDGGVFNVVVTDNGYGFDTSRVTHVRPSCESVRGFGTFIMHELMDEIEYSERGTRLRLAKRTPAAWESTERSLREA